MVLVGVGDMSENVEGVSIFLCVSKFLDVRDVHSIVVFEAEVSDQVFAAQIA